MMVKPSRSATQKRPARHVAWLLLFLGWFATGALGACFLHVPSSAALDPASGLHELVDHTGNTDDMVDECCVLSLDAHHQPVLAVGSLPAQPEPVAVLPASNIATGFMPAVDTSMELSDTNGAFDHIPLYLLYGRLLIPSFS